MLLLADSSWKLLLQKWIKHSLAKYCFKTSFLRHTAQSYPGPERQSTCSASKCYCKSQSQLLGTSAAAVAQGQKESREGVE